MTKKKHTYRATAIENVRLEALVPALLAGSIVAIDAAKEKFVVALATWTGEVVQVLRFVHPTQTRVFLELIVALQKQLGADKLKAAMEPTGTYGDAVRHQLFGAGVRVEMVQPKRTYDSREVFDGVPSLHDGKSAVLLARLCALGMTRVWEGAMDLRVKLRALVEERGHEYSREERCLGRLEALLARHWPEFARWLSVRGASAMVLLQRYASPARVAADPEGARELLRTTSRQRLTPEVIEGTVRDAVTTLGVPMTEEEEQFVRTLASEGLVARQAQDVLEGRMEKLVGADQCFTALKNWMGTYTAAVLMAFCDPRQFAHADELQKTCGLNLRVKSSGENKGKLQITKRGPALVRQVLYLFALRMIEASPEVKAWSEAREKQNPRVPAIVATMRKLVAATFHVARGAAFDPAKLFDLRRLDVPKTSEKKRSGLQPRKTPQSIIRSGRRGKQPQKDALKEQAAKDMPQEQTKSTLPWQKYLEPAV